MLVNIPSVTVALSEGGHPGYVVVASRDGLGEGAVVTLTSTALTKTGLKVLKLKGKHVYLWDPVAQADYDASAFLVADTARLVQAAQDLFGGIIRDFFTDPDEYQTPLATSELASILASVMPGGGGAPANVTVTNFPAQQHVLLDTPFPTQQHVLLDNQGASKTAQDNGEIVLTILGGATQIVPADSARNEVLIQNLGGNPIELVKLGAGWGSGIQLPGNGGVITLKTALAVYAIVNAGDQSAGGGVRWYSLS